MGRNRGGANRVGRQAPVAFQLPGGAPSAAALLSARVVRSLSGLSVVELSPREYHVIDTTGNSLGAYANPSSARQGMFVKLGLYPRGPLAGQPRPGATPTAATTTPAASPAPVAPPAAPVVSPSLSAPPVASATAPAATSGYAVNQQVQFQASRSAGGNAQSGVVLGTHPSQPLAIVYTPGAPRPYHLVNTQTGQGMGTSMTPGKANAYMNVAATNMATAPASAAPAAPVTAPAASTAPPAVVAAPVATPAATAAPVASAPAVGTSVNIPSVGTGTLRAVHATHGVVDLPNGRFAVVDLSTSALYNTYANPSAARQGARRAAGLPPTGSATTPAAPAAPAATPAAPVAAPAAPPAPVAAPAAPVAAPVATTPPVAPVATAAPISVPIKGSSFVVDPSSAAPVTGQVQAIYGNVVSIQLPNGRFQLADSQTGAPIKNSYANANAARNGAISVGAIPGRGGATAATAAPVTPPPVTPAAPPPAVSAPVAAAPAVAAPAPTPAAPAPLRLGAGNAPSIGQQVVFGSTGQNSGVVTTVSGNYATVQMANGQHRVVDLSVGLTTSVHGSAQGAARGLNTALGGGAQFAPATPAAPAAAPAPVAPTPVSATPIATASSTTQYLPTTDAEIVQAQSGLRRKMTAGQRAAVVDYEDNSYYQPVNRKLRGQPETHPLFTNYSAQQRTDAIIQDLDSVMKSGNAVTHRDMEVYRGVRSAGDVHGFFAKAWAVLEPKIRKAKIGDEEIDDGFLSTTVNYNVATGNQHRSIGQPGGFGGGAILTIRVPKGTPAIAMNAVNPGSTYSSSEELLLNRGIKKRLVDKRQDSAGVWHLTYEVV